MSSQSTLTNWLQHQAETQGSAIALRHKRLGIWQQQSWADIHHQVLRLANQLKARQFGVGDTLYLLSYPRPEALLMSLAAHWLGGISAPLDPGYPGKSVVALLRQLQPKFIFAEAENQLALLSQAALDPALLLYAESKGLSKFRFSHLVDVHSAATADSILQPLERVSTAEYPAFRFYRLDISQQLEVKSLNHQTLIQQAEQFIQKERVSNREEALAARSFAASGHIRYLLAPWLVAGFTLNFPENIETRDNDRRELGPSFVVGTAETYQRLYQLVQTRLPIQGSWRRKWLDWSLSNATSGNFIKKLPGRWLAIHPLKDVIGFSRIKVALLVGKPLSPEAERFFSQLGIQVKNWDDYLIWQPLVRPSRPETTTLSPSTVELSV